MTCRWTVGLVLLSTVANGWTSVRADQFAKWEKAMAAFALADAKTPFPKGETVFVGSSSIRLWNLKLSFPSVVALNRGFGGSQITDVVHFVDRLVLRHEPRRIVFYAGDNDIAAGKSPEQVASAFAAFVDKVRTKLPAAEVIFLSIKPSPSRAKWAAAQQRANALVADLCKTRNLLRFVDVGAVLLDESGKPKPEYFKPDMLHLNEAGYAAWTKLLEPLLQRNAVPPQVPATVRVAGIVLKWQRGDKEANFRRLEPMVRSAAANGAKLVCTTECFLDGYAIADKSIPLATYRSLGESIPDGPYCKRLARLADELNIHLVAGMLEAAGEDRFNTALLFDPDGKIAGKYRKRKLGHESVRNRAGDESPVFATPYGKIGLMICADRTEASIVNQLRDNGADWIVCPSGGMFGPQSNDPIVQARSRETGLPILFVHPAEFLATSNRGEILKVELIGNKLLVPADRVGTAEDDNRVVYFDMPTMPCRAAHQATSAGK